MPWYKVDCRHGPGHQGHHVWYLEADNREEAISYAEFEIDSTHWDFPVWKIRKVSKFPRKELERLIHKKIRHLEAVEEDIADTKRQIEELKSLRSDTTGPHPEDVDYVKCKAAKQKHSCIRGATSKCVVSRGEPGDKGWPFKKVFSGMCMDCKEAELFLKKKEKVST